MTNPTALPNLGHLEKEMRCYRDTSGPYGPMETLYFTSDFERLPRAMREAGLFIEVPIEGWDLSSVAEAIEQSGWTVRFRRQIDRHRTVAAE